MKRTILALLVVSTVHAAAAQTDHFGRTITDNGNGTYTVGGLTVTAPSPAAAVSVFDAMAPAGWAPPVVPQTTISPEDFLSRFTLAEQTALMTGAQQSVQLNLWLTKATAATVIDVTDPRTTAGMAALVSAGILSAPRSAQILDLSQASP